MDYRDLEAIAWQLYCADCGGTPEKATFRDLVPLAQALYMGRASIEVEKKRSDSSTLPLSPIE